MTKRVRAVRFRVRPHPALVGRDRTADSRGRGPNTEKTDRARPNDGCGTAGTAARGLRISSNMVRRNTRSGSVMAAAPQTGSAS